MLVPYKSLPGRAGKRDSPSNTMNESGIHQKHMLS